MTKKLKTEIKLEVEEAVLIRPQRVLLAQCRWCGKQVPMLATNEAALMTGLSARAIYRLVEAGQLHFIEDQNGLLFVCLASLDQLDTAIRGADRR